MPRRNRRPHAADPAVFKSLLLNLQVEWAREHNLPYPASYRAKLDKQATRRAARAARADRADRIPESDARAALAAYIPY